MNKLTLFIVSLFLLNTVAFGQNDCILDMDAPNKLVNDFADILTPSEENQLEQKLVGFDRSTSTQITVVTVTDLCGYDRAQFTYTLGENWGVGQKGFDNGIVVMIKPTGGKGQRHTFIAPGYGLEAVIPDATAKRIVEVEMIPQFKNGKFYSGIDKATSILMQLSSKEFSAKQYHQKAKSRKPIFPFIFVILIVIFLFISKVQRARRYSMGHDVSFWTAMWLLSNSGHRRGGGWGNFNSGGGSFGGFGGGSFGGGGAGGSW